MAEQRTHKPPPWVRSPASIPGRSQAVRHRIFIPFTGGSNPAQALKNCPATLSFRYCAI